MNNKIIALAAIALGAISASAQDAAPASGPSLGGSVGLGTILFALGIGPLVHRTLPLFDLRRRRDARRTVSAA